MIFSRSLKMAAVTCSFITALAGCSDASGTATGESVGEANEAFSGNWNYSWGDTKQSAANIGTSINRTCFLTGITGTLAYDNNVFNMTDAGLTIDQNKDYQIFVTTRDRPLEAFVRCVNSAAGRTDEETWMTGYPAKVLGAVTPNRRCFLTRVGAENGNTGAGFRSASDHVRIWNHGIDWYIGGTQSGDAWGAGRCIDVNNDDGSWSSQAGNPGTKTLPLTSVAGATCFLTGVGGDFRANDWSDGVFITQEVKPEVGYYTPTFFLNTKNGKTGWTSCVN